MNDQTWMSGLGEFHQGRVNTEPKSQIQKNQLKSWFKCLVPVRARWDRPSADALAWRLRKPQTQKNRLEVGLCISLVDNKEMVPVGGLEPPRLFSNGF